MTEVMSSTRTPSSGRATLAGACSPGITSLGEMSGDARSSPHSSCFCLSANKYRKHVAPDRRGGQGLIDKRQTPRAPRGGRAGAPGAKAGRPLRTQDERRAASERRLVAAACEVLARKGWIGMTLAEVGHKAGVSRGLASHHFGSKAGLLRALTKHIDDSCAALMRAAPPAAPGLASVLGFVSVYLGRTDPRWTNTRTLLLLMAEALIDGSENAPVLGGGMARGFEHLEEKNRIGIRKGGI